MAEKIFNENYWVGWASPVAQMVKICLQCQRSGFDPWVGKILWRREWTTHSSILAWKIPWTEKPGVLQLMGRQRVRHDWSDLAAAAAAYTYLGFLHGMAKNPPANAGDIRNVNSVPGSGGSPGGGNGNPLWYSCLENSMDRGTGRATVHRVAKSWIQLRQLSTA